MTDDTRPPRRHHLKTWPSDYDAVRSGRCAFEYRRNDRDFCVGDEIVLEEWDPEKRQPFPGPGGGTVKGTRTGRQLRAYISYILQGRRGVPEGYSVLALRDVEVIE